MLTGLEFSSPLIAERNGKVGEGKWKSRKVGLKVPVRPEHLGHLQQPMRIVRGGNEFIRPFFRVYITLVGLSGEQCFPA